MPSQKTNPNPACALNPDQWVDEHGDCLYWYALIRVRTREVAQDLVQETLLAALKNAADFAGRSSERSWLYGILKNKIVDYYRKLGRETSFTDMQFLSDEYSEKFVDGSWIHRDAPTTWKPEVDAVAHRAEFWAVMRSCLNKLPGRIASAFLLREMEEISTKEICQTLSVSESNLWVMLHRARMGLRECLETNWFYKPEKKFGRSGK